MSKIHVMNENLANKIAAGEVVEKIASVVKELVENSIDAHAKNIIVSLIDSGLKCIEVLDDGDGMDKEDAALAFGRHATSKLIRDDDLFFIDTLGFRGEALPSIASVSDVVLTTCSCDIGTLIEIKGGSVLRNEEAPARKGTCVKVSDLFYNTPARLKYLKTEASELANCVSLIERLALSHDATSFTLKNNDHVLVKTSGSGNLHKCIHEIYGLNVSSKMLEIKASNDDFDLYGYVCKPEILKSNRNHFITMVNDRVVKNYDINRAINDAYYTYKPDTKFPIVVLKINTDPTLIDVNVHPTKQDIKLSKITELYDLIYNTIKDALYKSLLIPDAIKKPEYNEIKDNYVDSFVKEVEKKEDIYQESNQVSLDLSYNEEKPDTVIINEEMKSLVLYPVGVALGTYIIAQNEEGVYLIDQHAAQERVNYERYLKALKEKEISTTSLLFPITIELSSSEFLIVKNNIDVLLNMGFDIEEFGVNTFVFKGHPTWLKTGYEEESIHKIVDIMIHNNGAFDPIKFNEHIAITLACKMSIKANMRISMEAVEELLQELVLCDNPYNCPHGRPTIIKFSIYDLERMFKRVMN
jgi:DNA mismatch repair protein MutL